MLAEDYLLKQVTASFIHPDTDLGRKFWSRVYARAQKELGTSDIPVDTFNKVWVSADKADVFVRQDTVVVVGSHLKVQLEADYLASSKAGSAGQAPVQASPASELSKTLIREIVLPELEKEVNTGKNFARLRQIFHAMILATWYKKNLKAALLTQVYANKSKMGGVEGAWVAGQSVDIDPQQIWSRYEAAYKQGVFNFIKEDIDQATGEAVPRKYFSGGLMDLAAARVVQEDEFDHAAAEPRGRLVDVAAQMQGADNSMASVNKALESFIDRNFGAVKLDDNLSRFVENAKEGEDQEHVVITQLAVMMKDPQASQLPSMVKALFQMATGTENKGNIWLIKIAIESVTSKIGVDLDVQRVLNYTVMETGRNYLDSKLHLLEQQKRISKKGKALLAGNQDRSQAFSREDIVYQLNKINRLLQNRKEKSIFVRMGGNVRREQKELEIISTSLMEATTVVSKHDWQRIMYEDLYRPKEQELTHELSKDGGVGSLNPGELSLADQLKEWAYKITANSPTATAPFQIRFRGDNVVLPLPENLQPQANYWELCWSWDVGGYVVAYKVSGVPVPVAIPGDMEFVREFYLRLLKAGSAGTLRKFEQSATGVTALIKERVDALVNEKMTAFKEQLDQDQSQSSGREALKSQRVDQAGDNVKGGIDLNAAQMTMSETGDKAGMAFDPAMLAQFQRGDFTGITPVITRITSLPGLLSLMGLEH